MGIDIQDVTLLEATLLLGVNVLGVLVTWLAWRVSDVDVREAATWEPPVTDPDKRRLLRHNRCVVTEDARHGELQRLRAHVLIALVGVFWILTPQPVNPDVVWWAVAIRCAVIALTLLLIDKTLHHLVARWRFDRPEESRTKLSHIEPALALAWRDTQARGLVHRT
jgi:hypothetical protein